MSRQTSNSVVPICHKLVAQSADCEQIARFRWFRLDIFAQAYDKTVDGSRVRLFVQVPNVLKNCLSRYRVPSVLNQIAEQIRLHHRQLHRLFPYVQLQVAKIHDLIAAKFAEIAPDRIIKELEAAIGAPRDDWPLPDPKGQGIESVRQIRDEIERRVRGLVSSENAGR